MSNINPFRFGDPNLIVMGVVEQTFYDGEGNIVAYDKLGSDMAINYTYDIAEITGGLQNMLAGLIPHSTRLSGTYTSAAFSLKSRELLSGGNLSHEGAISTICVEVTAANNKITLGSSALASHAPVKALAQPATDTYGWCQVRKKGAATYSGANYGIDLSTGEVQTSTVDGVAIANGEVYEVIYFTNYSSVNTNAEILNLLAAAQPVVVTVRQKWCVYRQQGGSAKQGTLYGYLYVEVPRALVNGDAGITGNQTTNSTSEYSWRALAPDENVPNCAACENDASNYAYYVLVPCSESTDNVQALAVIGGGVSVVVDATATIPVKFVVDGELVQPNYSDTGFTFTSAATATATVSAGVVTGKQAGSTTITITYVTSDGRELTTVCPVTVTAA